MRKALFHSIAGTALAVAVIACSASVSAQGRRPGNPGGGNRSSATVQPSHQSSSSSNRSVSSAPTQQRPQVNRSTTSASSQRPQVNHSTSMPRQHNDRPAVTTRSTNERPNVTARPSTDRPNVVNRPGGNNRPQGGTINHGNGGNNGNRPNGGNRSGGGFNNGGNNRPGGSNLNNGGNNRPDNGGNNRPDNGGNGGNHRPDNGGNYGNGGNHRPGNGGNYGNGGNHRPGNGGNYGNGGNHRPGNGGNYGNGGTHRPGYGGSYGNHRPGNNGRPGGHMNRPPQHHGGINHGGPRPDYNRYRWTSSFRPRNRYDRWYDYYRYNRWSWRAPIAPPHRPWRPRIVWYYRPVIPVGYTYHISAPLITGVLGLEFGTYLDASLNYLYYNGYNIDGYQDNVVYLRDVHLMGYSWPDVMLQYSNDGGMCYAEFATSSTYQDNYRFNNLYNSLCATYGTPIHNNGYYSWYGGNGTGFVNLHFTRDNGRYYTVITFGA